MFLKNFFEEFLEIKSEEQVEQAVQAKYGLPADQQRIFRINGRCILALRRPPFTAFDTTQINIPKHSNGKFIAHPGSETECPLQRDMKLPDELKELGVSQEDYSALCEIYRDSTALKAALMPYTFGTEDPHQQTAFAPIDKSNLENVDQFIKEIPESEKDRILGNLDSYISSFINLN